MKRKSEPIVDEWSVYEYEPRVLLAHEDVLSKKLNYDRAYLILGALIDQLGLEYHDVYINFSRRSYQYCGCCQTFYTSNPSRFIHKITLYKGHYTLGTLLHEYAHAVVHQRDCDDSDNIHGVPFKGWFIILVRTAEWLLKNDPLLQELWETTGEKR